MCEDAAAAPSRRTRPFVVTMTLICKGPAFASPCDPGAHRFPADRLHDADAKLAKLRRNAADLVAEIVAGLRDCLSAPRSCHWALSEVRRLDLRLDRLAALGRPSYENTIPNSGATSSPSRTGPWRFQVVSAYAASHSASSIGPH